MSDQLYEHVKQKVAELRQLKNYSVYEVDYNDTYDEYEDYLDYGVSQFECELKKRQEDCKKRLEETWKKLPQNETWCRGELDGLVCWDHGSPDQLVSVPCFSFFSWNDNLQMHRYCNKNGSWYHRPNHEGVMEIWEMKENCSQEFNNASEVLEALDANMPLDNALTLIYIVGVCISLLCLVAALFILSFLRLISLFRIRQFSFSYIGAAATGLGLLTRPHRKLHCTRNYIHINLMISFIVRYIVILMIISNVYTDLSGDTTRPLDCDSSPGISGVLIACRLTTVFTYYGIMANYFWLLVEGVYLQMLLSFAMSEHKYFPIFMAFGWGAPWFPIVVWIALRLTYENKGCWNVNDNNHILWVLRIPLILSITVNFVIFINIIRIIVAKLRANHMRRNDYKYRLAKSTLALIPLLGIHYIVFLVVMDEVTDDQTVIKVKRSFQIVLTSIQGALIAVLYCFMNGEVQAELNKVWRNWKHQHGQPPPRKSQTNTGTPVTSVTSAHSDSGHQHDANNLKSQDGRESAIVTSRSDDHTDAPDASYPLISNRHTVVQERSSDV